MKLRGSLLVIVCCLVMELCNLPQKDYEFIHTVLNARVFVYSFQGLLFLVYPLVGHLTDVYLTRYRSLKWSFALLIVSSSAGTIYSVLDLVASSIWNVGIFHNRQTAVVLIIIIMVFFIGLGLFQANAIQFGLDQLQEAPTPKLIAFIHWYYWAQNFGSLVLFYVVSSALELFEEIDVLKNATLSQTLHLRFSKTLTTPLLIVVIVIQITILITFCTAKIRLYIQKAGLNPFKNIYKVLKYSWKHKVPEHRSAFTYWEEDIPRRIDLGKNKYGGPFTNEEVEDTKTFLRILPLLLCLFGYHLAGDGYSAPNQLQRTSCPSLPVLLLIVINPLHLSTLVAVVGIPLYRLVIAKAIPRLKNVRMLTKMWIGLYLSLLQVVLYIIVVVA